MYICTYAVYLAPWPDAINWITIVFNIWLETNPILPYLYLTLYYLYPGVHFTKRFFNCNSSLMGIWLWSDGQLLNYHKATFPSNLNYAWKSFVKRTPTHCDCKYQLMPLCFDFWVEYTQLVCIFVHCVCPLDLSTYFLYVLDALCIWIYTWIKLEWIQMDEFNCNK